MVVISVSYMSASGSEVIASRIFLRGDLEVHKGKIQRKALELGGRVREVRG